MRIGCPYSSGLLARRQRGDGRGARQFSPGIGFGPEGEGWVRLALIENRQRLLQATRNIKRAFTKWRSESQLSAK